MIQADLTSAIEADFLGARQDTALYDAILTSIAHASTRPSVNNRAVVVVSDGKDNASVATLSDVVNSAIQKGIPLFTISVGTDGAEQLQQLAQQTGGAVFPRQHHWGRSDGGVFEGLADAVQPVPNRIPDRVARRGHGFDKG